MKVRYDDPINHVVFEFDSIPKDIIGAIFEKQIELMNIANLNF